VTTGAIYVSPSGSDSAPGTEAQPLRTVSRGLAAVQKGQTLYLRGGTYVENVTGEMSKGTSGAPIVVSNYPGERPVIKGLVSIQQPTFVTFTGFNVTWNSGKYDEHMFKIVGGRNWVLQNSEIWGARSFANLLISGSPQNWVVRANAIHDTIGGEENIFRSHNIYANTELTASNGLIERNLLYNAEHGSNLKLAGTGGSSGGAANVVVRYNTIYNGTQPLLIGDGSRNIVVERNIIGQGRRGYLVRLFQLTGSGVVVRTNLGFAADEFCMDYDSSTKCSSIESDNVFPRDPKFAAGFKPTDAQSQAYGRYAP